MLMKAAACTILLFALTSPFALAQASSGLPDAPKPAPTATDNSDHGFKYVAVRLLKDQRDIYTAPFRPANYRAKYIIPFVIVAALFPQIATYPATCLPRVTTPLLRSRT